MTSLKDFTAHRIDGASISLADLQGQVLLIVNTASACGFTPQFEGLEELHTTYGPRGLAVIGFPCNQFGAQDAGTNAEIGAFCQRNYGVSFTMMEKVDVNRPRAPVVQVAQSRSTRHLGQRSDQVELHQILGGQRRARAQTLCVDGCASQAGERH